MLVGREEAGARRTADGAIAHASRTVAVGSSRMACGGGDLQGRCRGPGTRRSRRDMANEDHQSAPSQAQPAGPCPIRKYPEPLGTCDGSGLTAKIQYFKVPCYMFVASQRQRPEMRSKKGACCIQANQTYRFDRNVQAPTLLGKAQ